jgi:hypothetical protein
MLGLQNNPTYREISRRALRTLYAQLAIPALAFCLAATLPLAAQVRGADEVFPVVHGQPITLRILDGNDGHALAHARLSLVAGYNQRDLHLEMWRQDILTDDHGKARLPDALANLPFLQIAVAKTPVCEPHSGSATFSVDLIRRDGLSTANRCGTATVENTPGVFTVFVKYKSKPSKAQPPAATLAPKPSAAIPDHTH